METILFVCTGNLCRSPSAEWFLAHRLSEVGPSDVVVESAGTMGTVSKVPAELGQQGSLFGLNLRTHVPRRIDDETITRSDMIVGMERAHLREIVLAEPPAFARTFTMREIIRRGREVGQRRRGQTISEWLALIGEGRRHADLLGESPLDDTPDPMGGSPEEYRMMLTEMATLTRTLHSLTWPAS